MSNLVSKLRIKISSKQEWNSEEINFEPDSSPEAWKHFQKYYGHLQESKAENYDFVNLFFFSYTDNGYVDYPIRYYERLYSLPDSVKAISKSTEKGCNYYNAVSRLSGDTDFNFNEKKIDKYSRILFSSCDSEREYLQYMSKLFECHEMHRTLLNFSLMQTMGNLQGFKSMGLYGDYLDRLDSFVFYLNYFYTTKDKKESRVVKYLNGLIEQKKLQEDNKNILLKYLSSFENIYNYCSKIYFAGVSNEETKKIIEKLVIQGERKTNSAKRVIEYLELANEFWNVKENCFRIIDKKNRTWVLIGEPYHM